MVGRIDGHAVHVGGTSVRCEWRVFNGLRDDRASVPNLCPLRASGSHYAPLQRQRGRAGIDPGLLLPHRPPDPRPAAGLGRCCSQSVRRPLSSLSWGRSHQPLKTHRRAPFVPLQCSGEFGSRPAIAGKQARTSPADRRASPRPPLCGTALGLGSRNRFPPALDFPWKIFQIF
jgi:hypothetical protein